MPIDFQTTEAEAPDLDAYCDREDIEQIYGASNVASWADLENESDAGEIAAKINWACVAATNRMNDRLRDGPYEVPFDEPYSEQLVEMTARLAGVLLYDARGIIDMGQDGEPIHQLSAHRRAVMSFVMDVLSGRIHFASLDRVADYPQAVSLDD